MIELVHEYGFAKFGDEWWPGNAGPWIGDEKGAELGALLGTVSTLACPEPTASDQPTA